MDPFTHTLFGTVLADSGLRRTTALATTTLIVGANLPDIDFVTYFVDGDLALWARRGWTHGILALAVLPVLLTGLLLAWDRWVRRRRQPDAEPANPRILFALALLGVCSHPALDWLNTYGVRLLMPFDGRWFYGDVLFIIEPLLWLGLGGAVFLRHSQGLRACVAWAVLAGLMSLVVLGGSPGLGIKIVWIAGLLVLVGIRSLAWKRTALRGTRLGSSPWPARAALGFFAFYVGALMAGDAVAERAVRSQWSTLAGATDPMKTETTRTGTVETGWDETGRIGAGTLETTSIEAAPIEDLMVGPLPGNPFRRDVVVVSGEDYHFFTFDWRRTPRVAVADPARLPRPKLGSDPTVDAAMAAPCIRGMANWLRFPAAQVQPLDDGGHTVQLLDVRYTRRPTSTFGGAQVHLDADHQPLCHPP